MAGDVTRVLVGGRIEFPCPTGSGERRIFADKENWLDFLRAGSWSPDGKRLVFARGPSGVIRQPPTADVYVINVDGTGLSRLTRFDDAGDPSWSPDGSKIVFDRSMGDLYVMNADGTEVTRL